MFVQRTLLQKKDYLNYEKTAQLKISYHATLTWDKQEKTLPTKEFHCIESLSEFKKENIGSVQIFVFLGRPLNLSYQTMSYPCTYDRTYILHFYATQNVMEGIFPFYPFF